MVLWKAVVSKINKTTSQDLRKNLGKILKHTLKISEILKVCE